MGPATREPGVSPSVFIQVEVSRSKRRTSPRRRLEARGAVSAWGVAVNRSVSRFERTIGVGKVESRPEPAAVHTRRAWTVGGSPRTSIAVFLTLDAARLRKVPADSADPNQPEAAAPARTT